MKTFLFLIITSLFLFSSQLNAQVLPATCDDLLTDIDMWGEPARGIDLREYTNSTLHWIGCPTNGCNPENFFCEFDPDTQTLSFGSNGTGALRAAVDPNNEAGNTMPDADLTGECCTAEVPLFGVCNAPNSSNNGVPFDAADALCFVLGYESGSLTEIDNNFCPEANTTNSQGTIWTSDYVDSDGYGKTYTCVGFREVAPAQVPALSQLGLIALAGMLGVVVLLAIRRIKLAA